MIQNEISRSTRAGQEHPADNNALNCKLDCPHKKLLKQTLVEAIEVLESTRHAFKSKQIASLRKKLIQLLAAEF